MQGQQAPWRKRFEGLGLEAGLVSADFSGLLILYKKLMGIFRILQAAEISVHA